jgi:hypothetical protein
MPDENIPQDPDQNLPSQQPDLDKSLAELFERPVENDDSPPVENPPEKPETPPIGDPKPSGKDGQQRPPEAKEKVEEPAEKPESLVDPEKITMPTNLNKNNQAGWQTLHKKYKASYQENQKLQGKVKELEQVVASRRADVTGELEKTKKEVEELRGYRVILDYQNDPEYLEKYATPLSEIEKEMDGLLESLEVSPELRARIDYTDPKLLAHIKASIEKHSDEFNAGLFKEKASEYLKLDRERQKAIASNKANAAEYFSKREKAQSTRSVEDQARSKTHAETFAEGKAQDGNPIFPFFLKKEIRPGASRAESEQVSRHNEQVDVLRTKALSYLNDNSPEHKAEMAVASVAAIQFRNELVAAHQQIKALQDEIKKIAKTTEVPEGRGRNLNPEGGSDYKVPESLELDDALATAFPNMR